MSDMRPSSQRSTYGISYCDSSHWGVFHSIRGVVYESWNLAWQAVKAYAEHNASVNPHWNATALPDFNKSAWHVSGSTDQIHRLTFKVDRVDRMEVSGESLVSSDNEQEMDGTFTETQQHTSNYDSASESSEASQVDDSDIGHGYAIEDEHGSENEYSAESESNSEDEAAPARFAVVMTKFSPVQTQVLLQVSTSPEEAEHYAKLCATSEMQRQTPNANSIRFERGMKTVQLLNSHNTPFISYDVYEGRMINGRFEPDEQLVLSSARLDDINKSSQVLHTTKAAQESQNDIAAGKREQTTHLMATEPHQNTQLNTGVTQQQDAAASVVSEVYNPDNSGSLRSTKRKREAEDQESKATHTRHNVKRKKTAQPKEEIKSKTRGKGSKKALEPAASNEELYCACKKPDDGTKMVGCDGENCSNNGWVHLACQGLTTYPTSKTWMCLDCRKAPVKKGASIKKRGK